LVVHSGQSIALLRRIPDRILGSNLRSVCLLMLGEAIVQRLVRTLTACFAASLSLRAGCDRQIRAMDESSVKL
jgi:hypothetical protein